MKNSISATVFLFKIFFVFIFFFSLSANLKAYNTTYYTGFSGYAWSDNIGWVDMGNVVIDPLNGNISGYAWSDNIGWVSFNNSDVSSCPISPNCSPKLTSTGISGFAKALSGGSTGSGGWDGYIELDISPDENLVRRTSSRDFAGYAWGSDVVGWLDVGGVTFQPKVEGDCGTANAKSFLSKPTTDLCSAGLASTVTGSGNPWSWNCYGLNDGDNSTTCHAVVGPLSPIVNATITPEKIAYDTKVSKLEYSSQNADYCEVFTGSPAEKILYSVDYKWPTSYTWNDIGPYRANQSWTFRCYNSIGIYTDKSVDLTVCDLGEGLGCEVSISSLPNVDISPSVTQNISLDQKINFDSNAEDLGGDLRQHHFDIIKPSGETVYNASNSVSFADTASHNAKYTFTPETSGVYKIRASAIDSNNPWVSTDYVTINVQEDLTNATPTVTIFPSTNKEISLGDNLTIRSTTTDSSSDITRHHLDVKMPTGTWLYNVSEENAFAETGSHTLEFILSSDVFSMIGVYVIKVSACDKESSGACRWTDSKWITVTVLPFAKNGICSSSSNGKTFNDITELTNAGLCSQGIASSVIPDTVNNNWSWNCAGEDGGTTSGTCSANMARIDGEALFTPLEASNGESYYVYIPDTTTPDEELICIEGTLSNLTWNEAGSFWTFDCIGSGPGAVTSSGKIFTSITLPEPVIRLTAIPRSISRGSSVTLSWEVDNPNAYCRLTAHSSSIRPEVITELNRINKLLSKGYTRNDGFSTRRVVKSLVSKINGNKAIGKTTIENVNYPVEFQLSCKKDGSSAVKTMISVVRGMEG